MIVSVKCQVSSVKCQVEIRSNRISFSLLSENNYFKNKFVCET